MTDLVLPADADPNEAAAIAAALSAYLQAGEAEAESSDEEADAWAGKRWRYAARFSATGARRTRVPTDAPADPWAASGRTGWMR